MYDRGGGVVGRWGDPRVGRQDAVVGADQRPRAIRPSVGGEERAKVVRVAGSVPLTRIM